MKISFLHNHPQMEKDLGVPEDHVIVGKKELVKMMVFLIQNPRVFQFLVGKEEFEKRLGEPLTEPTIVMIKEESFPPGRSVLPSDREEWVPGCLGLRFSKWLRKWRKTL